MEADDLLGFITELSPKYRMVFNLYALEGYDHSEISQVLEISESTSKSQYLRAKQKIRDLINTNNDERPIRTIHQR